MIHIYTDCLMTTSDGHADSYGSKGGSQVTVEMDGWVKLRRKLHWHYFVYVLNKRHFHSAIFSHLHLNVKELINSHFALCDW